MTTTVDSIPATAERELVITRLIDAPRDLVFRMWTEPEHLIHWWGPEGFTNTFHKIDLRPGGEWRFTMHAPDGTDYPNRIIFQEILVPERLHYIHGSGVEGEEDDFEVTVMFEDEEGKTRLTMRMIFPSADVRNIMASAGVIEGGNQTVDRLERQLTTLAERDPSSLILSFPSDREIVMTRTFNVPGHLIFDAWTKPEHVRHWWGPYNTLLTVCEIDLRPGGSWRFVHHGPDDRDYGFSGTYLEIISPELLRYSFVFDDFPDHESIECLTFVEYEGKTMMTVITRYESAEVREQVIQSGMEWGATETMNNLASYLESLV